MALANNDLFIVQKPGTQVHYKIKLSELSEHIAETHGDLLWERTGTNLSPVNTGDSVLIGGTIPAAPNITLKENGEIITNADATINSVTVGRGGGGILTNTALGSNSLLNNTTGVNNTANGREALYSNTTGSSNTANGISALRDNTTGSANTAIGRQALYSNTEGSNNTANGRTALYFNTEGSNNTANGFSALHSNTIGSNNTANGFSALRSNTEGTNNTANGQQALHSNLTGVGNVALGHQAGYYIEGSNNTVLGARQGRVVDATLSDTVIVSAGDTEKLRIDSTGSLLFGGTLPSAPNTTITSTGAITAAQDATINGVTVGLGSGDILSNTALGSGSLPSNTTGTSNTAVGRRALETSTTGSGNTAVGTNSLLRNTTGNFNTAIGNSSLANNTKGGNNIAVGGSSLSATTEGINNTAVGRHSLELNTTGSENTAVGKGALSGNITGVNNIAVGSNSLKTLTSGDNNTFIGSHTGTETLSNTVSISAGTTEKLRIDSTGSLLFGGTLSNAPNITLNEDGSADFAGAVTSQGEPVVTSLDVSNIVAMSQAEYDALVSVEATTLYLIV